MKSVIPGGVSGASSGAGASDVASLGSIASVGESGRVLSSPDWSNPAASSTVLSSSNPVGCMSNGKPAASQCGHSKLS
eukprot:CAMPEP_0182577316 /NCGR_PEP_ID=MMETSP1324-20130603/37189_1 /TAXON_ID=236786 /ORGANISM="Florenciella sp., Strain RCC1587" /LENGTH=77 /DNA_ID=CAMNT_0024793125 /DNA_START=9 /DNA_END=242 /DNA_ORIENTATION=+